MKKFFLNLTAWFRRPKYITPEFKTEEKYTLQIIDDDSDHTFRTLGISEERFNFFKEKCEEMWKPENTYLDVAIALSKECVHSNEVYLVAYLVEHAKISDRMPQIQFLRLGGVDSKMAA